MELFWWFLTIVLFAVGLIGTVAPVLPGTAIILAAAIIHRIMLGPDKSVGWYTILVLVLLTLATYGLDVLADEMGNVRRDSRRTGRVVLRPDRPVRWSGDWRDRR
jgi:uncharacterized protein YqgC (DUF456 family)